MPVDVSDDAKGESSAASLLRERRFKLSRACDRCRRRRIKCDEGHPCQACLSSTSECTFEEPGKRTHPKSKRTTTLEDRMRQLETLIQAIPPSVFASSSGGMNGSPSSSSTLSDFPSPLQANFPHATQAIPHGVPPPSLSSFPLMNPGTHFTHPGISANTLFHAHGAPGGSGAAGYGRDLDEDMARMSLSPSYLYLDNEGYTRWQGETSGLPLLDLLVERHAFQPKEEADHPISLHNGSTTLAHGSPEIGGVNGAANGRQQGQPHTEINAEALWKAITSTIVPELMDSLVQCYLSTSYYLMPFLHVPTFLADYGNPAKWGEPGFACFVVALCCLSSRHIDDPRVRADPNDGISAGGTWFELFLRLRSLPGADRPTLYMIQAVLVAGVYAVGAGKLSKAFALLSEAITLSVDAGLHRTSHEYDYFDSVEEEVRKRTFWCVYLWDKQAAAHFGRPPMIRLRDCDVREPAVVDDECLGVGAGIDGASAGQNMQNGKPETESRMYAFLCTIRMFVVMESVIDTPPSRSFGEASPFLTRATGILSGFKRHNDLLEEERLLDEVVGSIPPYWRHSPETMASEDVIRVTQAERLLCVEQFVRMLIHRHRFSECVAERAHAGAAAAHAAEREMMEEEAQSEAECEAIKAAHACALQIVSAHLHIGLKGMMTWYGVHVIHQLTQAGRTLVSIVLNSDAEPLRALKTSSLDALRSCVGLLRRFSGRYLCGMRSSDMMEEFCRLTQIPLDAPARLQDGTLGLSSAGPPGRSRTPWMKPVRKKTGSQVRSASRHEASGSASNSPSAHGGSPESFSPDIFLDLPSASPPPSTSGPFLGFQTGVSQSMAGVGGVGLGMGVGGVGFGDADAQVQAQAQLAMSPAEILALFSDGNGPGPHPAQVTNPFFRASGSPDMAAATRMAHASQERRASLSAYGPGPGAQMVGGGIMGRG